MQDFLHGSPRPALDPKQIESSAHFLSTYKRELEIDVSEEGLSAWQ